MEAKLIEPTSAKVFMQCCILKNQGKPSDYADGYADMIIEENLLKPINEIFRQFKSSDAGYFLRANYGEKLDEKLNKAVKAFLK